MPEQIDHHSRIKLVKLFVLLWVLVILYRLADLQWFDQEFWLSKANKQQKSSVELAGYRGRIFDRNGVILATSVKSSSVFIRPKLIEDPNQVIETIASNLEIPFEKLNNKLQKESPFVWIKRQVPGYIGDAVKNQKLAGLYSQSEPSRFYPFAHVGSVLIGAVGVDGQGLSGLEANYNKRLNPQKKSYIVFKDAKGKKLDLSSNVSEEKGEDLHLTIDIEIQQIMQKALDQGLVDFQAKSGMALMLDPDTGEILGMVQSPSANFNQKKIKSVKALQNQVIQSAYEPGSTIKPLVVAWALEKGVIDFTDNIKTENGEFRIGRNRVRDVHPYKKLSIPEVVIYSSNIGMSKIGFLLGKEELYQAFRAFGFGQKTAIGLKGEASGILRNYKNWVDIDLATQAFGQGIAVSPLQLVRAFSSLVNDGYVPDLKLLRSNQNLSNTQERVNLFSAKTLNNIRSTLVKVVEEGTGKKTKVKGLIVGGKTGTAQKARENGRGYQDGVYMSSFIGFADGQPLGINKKVVVYVLYDEPGGKVYYGGSVAGPVFKKIIEQSFYLFGVRNHIDAK